MSSWMLYLWFDLQFYYFYFWSIYDFRQIIDQIWLLEARWMIFYQSINIRTDLNFIFGQFSVARKLIKWRSYQADRFLVTNNYNLAADNYKAEYINVSVILMPWLIDELWAYIQVFIISWIIG